RRRLELPGAQADGCGGDALPEAPGPGQRARRARRRSAQGPEGARPLTGYGGRLLFADLTTGATRIEALDARTARQLLGGNGLAARLLYDHVPAGTDPFAPANAVVLGVGPITDTTVPGNSRACVASKSPLTGLFFDSTFGGRFPATLKRTGFDAVVVTGRAAAPSYLLVTETGAEIRPASQLWGRATRDTVQALVAAEGADADALAIGPAGEARVRFAALAHYWKNREGVSGRGGLGAVLGAKHLKAVVVRGARKTEVADPAALKALVEQTREPLAAGTKALSTYGTPFLVGPINALGALGSYNVKSEVFAEAAAVGGEAMKARYHDRDTTCLKCPVACGKQYAIGAGEFTGTRAKMPEYETIFALGPMLGIAEPEALILANDLCDLLGMDTISMGVTLAFVCEALERGWLTPADVGVPFGWGDWRGMLRLVELTARREGFGARLAEGAWRLAESVHPDATKLVYAVKRLELPAHSARALKGLAIGYATATRGGSHHDTRPTPQYAPGFDRRGTAGKPAFAARSQHFTAVGDSLVLCRFTAERGFGLFLDEPYARMLRAVTGWDVTVEELERTGERIINLERLFNVREGVRRAQDTLPWKVMHEPIPDGPSAGAFCPPEELDAMLDEYYALRGWDGDGVPTPARLAALGLST
ncbi:MAG: aldehyde ferredoxin oxidoreductase family protein, partial [Candidatus Rokubacteria bacterium]|nr:aldehyde ferredoxin oxidoreductase family protein [Candidatus Rokubacteria bacterium]